MTVPLIPLTIDHPPEVVQIGSAVHGVYLEREVFSLPDLWQLHFYLYETQITAGRFRGSVHKGDVSLWPPGTLVDQKYFGRSNHLYVHFRLNPSGTIRQVPMVQHCGRHAAVVADLLLSALGASLSHHAQVVAHVWAVLCLLTAPEVAPAVPRPVAAALLYIEAHLAESLRVPLIAHEVGLSHNQLTRQFTATMGRSPVSYIRGRRLARARHLLVASTQSIRSIAAAVGIPDIQAFNKACHRELGCSPSAVRRGYAREQQSFTALALVDAGVADTDRPRHFNLGAGIEIFLDAPIAGMELLRREVADTLGAVPSVDR